MSDSPTVRKLFSIPEDPAKGGSPAWDRFRHGLAEEVKGVKWPAAMPDLTQKVCELFEVPVPNILIAGWKKADAIKKVIDESKAKPKEEMEIALAEHTLNSEFHPYVEVRIKSLPPKKVEFAVALSFNLKGFVLKVQKGLIKEVHTGECEVEGTIKYKDLTLAEKKLEPIELPGSIPIEDQPSPVPAPPGSD